MVRVVAKEEFRECKNNAHESSMPWLKCLVESDTAIREVLPRSFYMCTVDTAIKVFNDSRPLFPHGAFRHVHVDEGQNVPFRSQLHLARLLSKDSLCVTYFDEKQTPVYEHWSVRRSALGALQKQFACGCWSSPFGDLQPLHLWITSVLKKASRISSTTWS